MIRVRRVLFSFALLLLMAIPINAQENDKLLLPDSLQVITPENADQITEIKRLGPGWVQKIACSPDGQLLAASATTGVYLHEMSNPNAEPRYLPHEFDFYRDSGDVIFSPDGKMLVRIGPEISTLWDIDRSEIVAVVPTVNEYSLNYSNPFRFTDKRILAIHLLEETILVIDVGTEEIVYEVPVEEQDAYYIFSPDASKVIVNSVGSSIHVWDVAQGKELHTYILPDKFSTRLFVWSPDGRYLSIWNADVLHVFDSQHGNFWQDTGINFAGAHAWSPDSRYIAASTRGGLRVYSAETGEIIAWKELALRRFAFNPDSNLIIGEAFIKGDVLINWSIQTDQFQSVPYSEIDVSFLDDLVFCLDGQIVALSDFDNRIRLFNPDTLEQTDTLRYSGQAHAVTFSPNSNILAVGSATAISLTEPGWDGAIWLWNLNDFSRINELDAHRTRVRGLDFSSDGRFLVSVADWYGDAHLWNVETGEVLAKLSVSDEVEVPFIDAFFVPDQSRIGTHASYAPIVRWWKPDVEIDTSNQPPTGLVSRSANISNSGKFYATSGHNSGVFESDSEARLLTFQDTTVEETASLAFNPSDTLIAAGLTTDEGGSVEVWSLEELTRQFSMIVHEEVTDSGNPVWVAFTVDGQILFAAGSDKIKVIDVDRGEEITTLSVNGTKILSLALSPDGRLIATGMYDGTIRLWGVVE